MKHGVQLANILLDIPSVPKIMNINALQVLPQIPDVDTLIYESREVQLASLVKKLDQKTYGSGTNRNLKATPTVRNGSNDSTVIKKSKGEASKITARQVSPVGNSRIDYKKHKINCDAGKI